MNGPCQKCGHAAEKHDNPGHECVHLDDDGCYCPCSWYRGADQRSQRTSYREIKLPEESGVFRVEGWMK